MIAHDNFAWPATRVWLEEQIEIEREALEQIGVPSNVADGHRGAIDAFRRIIKTVVPVVITPSSDAEDSSEEPPIYHEA